MFSLSAANCTSMSKVVQWLSRTQTLRAAAVLIELPLLDFVETITAVHTLFNKYR